MAREEVTSMRKALVVSLLVVASLVLGALVTVLAIWAVWDERQHPHAHA